MKTLPLTASIALIASVAAFIAGRATAPDGPTTESEASIAIPERSTNNPLRSGSGNPSSTLDLRGNLESPLSENSAAVNEMKRIIGTVDPLARAQAWLDFINTLEPDQFESVVAEFRGSGFARGNMGEYGMLLTAWAKIDPFEALDYAKESTGTPFARNTILASWVTSDPEAAIAWAKENHEGDKANPWMVGVIRGLAQYDPARASQLMTSMPYSEERGDALRAVIPHIMSQGGDAAKAWAISVEDERLRGGAIRRVSEQLAKEDPVGTVDWLITEGGESASGAIDNVMSVWAKENSSAAIAHYESIPPGPLRTNALRGLTNQMAAEDPRAAADFLDANANDADDNTYRQFVWNSFRGEPAIAANYIGRMKDTEQRDRMYRRTLEGWMWRDMESASEWMSSTPLPDNVATHLERRMQDISERRR